MSVDGLITNMDELRAATGAGMRITITAGSGPKSVTSLAFLAPIVADIRDLWVNTVNRITDVEVLNDARNLRSLAFATGSCDGRADLSALPHLEEFGGYLTRAVASVLQNRSLRFLRVEGAIPKTFARVAGPVEKFEQNGARSQSELPLFSQPEKMRTLWRAGPARFDLGHLSAMIGLIELDLGACDDVVGLSEISNLRGLERLTFNGCTTREPWETLPMVPWGYLNEVHPIPSEQFLTERRQAGWMVPDVSEGDIGSALTLDEAGDGDSWGVFMSRFDDLAAAVELFDDSIAGGMHGEYFILGVVAELRDQGAVLDPEPDSESGFTAVYFPDRAQAEQVFARAQELLVADPATQLRFLRAGRN